MIFFHSIAEPAEAGKTVDAVRAAGWEKITPRGAGSQNPGFSKWPNRYIMIGD